MELEAGQLEALADSLVESHDKLLRDLIGMRKKHRLSQETVAERMGVSQPTVAAFERYDSNPTLSSIRRYALAVGASITHVVDDKCCRTDSESFTAVVVGSARTWASLSTPEMGWGPGRWATGETAIRTYV